jgi:Arc/MetJ-type ribon-helix-helix transcriptional regulator
MKDDYINVRVSADMKAKIDALVADGTYESITDFVRQAIKTQLVFGTEKKKELTELILSILENEPRVRDIYKKD